MTTPDPSGVRFAGRVLDRSRRHPAEVTADRLRDAMDKWPDHFDGADRDMISQIAHVLDQIAEGVTP